jgi:hypothetical protein
LEHSYRLGDRVSVDSRVTTYRATQTTFEREVRIRFYRPLHEVGFSSEACERLRQVIESGGDGDFAIDYGEIDVGSPFLVTRCPRGTGLSEWWSTTAQTPVLLARFGRALLRSIRRLTPGQRIELTLDRIYVQVGDDCQIRLDLYCLGDSAMRGELREMSRVVSRDLVTSFPPECFIPPTRELDGLEEAEAADVYRVAAVLCQLASGIHPVFPANIDVAAAVGRLVNDVAPSPPPPRTGSCNLDDLIAAGVSVDPGQRPSMTDLAEGLRDIVEWDAEQVELDKEAVSGRRPSRPWTLLAGLARRAMFVALILAACVATYYWANRPPKEAAIVITSDPAGVEFERVSPDGTTSPLGTTPLLLQAEAVSAALQIRPVYPDGRLGALQTITPDRLQVYDACRSLHVRFGQEAPR